MINLIAKIFATPIFGIVGLGIGLLFFNSWLIGIICAISALGILYTGDSNDKNCKEKWD